MPDDVIRIKSAQIEAPRPCLAAGRHKARLPGKVILFHIVPLDPTPKAGITGHIPVTRRVLLNGKATIGKPKRRRVKSRILSR